MAADNQKETISVDAAGRIEEAQRLRRFHVKTLGEACHLKADALVFQAGKEQTRVQLMRAGSELKSIGLERSWFDSLYESLALCGAACLDELLRYPAVDDGIPGMPAVVGNGDELFLFRIGRVERTGGERRFSLLGVRLVRRADLAAALQIAAECRDAFGALLEPAPGLLIVAAPQNEQTAAARTIALALTEALPLGAMRDEQTRAFAEQRSADFPLLVTTEAGDAVAALLKLREYGYKLDQLVLRGVLCLGLVEANCASCAREAVLDRKVIDMLPPPLQPRGSHAGYRVGRGCDDCGQRGYKGLTCVESLITEEQGGVMSLLRGGAKELQMLAALRPRGLRALLEDGVEKVLNGQTTFEKLYQVVRSMPEAYIKDLQQREAAPPREQTPLEVDFYGGEAAAARPISGKDAFYQQPAKGKEPGLEPGDDVPLFSVGPAGRIREKPLLLVVEDDKDQRNILEIVLRGAGYQVKLVGGGREALQLLNREVPDLILTDLMMPEMDGAEFVAKLRADPRFQRVPIMVLTVLADGDREYTMLDLGADDYCEKTVQRKILLKRIEKLLKRHAAG